jgi:glycosyltransferase involved in cell wall biosynthesis
MCTYNGEAYVREQLESLVRQTRLPDELVVCDDCSTDDTTRTLAEFARHAPFAVRVVGHKSNLGVTANYEHAITLCSGDTVFLCDQDDVWHADKIAVTAAALEASPHACAAFSDSEVVDAQLRPRGYSLWDACAFTAAARRAFPERAVEILLEGNKVQGATLAFRASCRSILLPISARWTYDAWLGVVLAACGLIVVDRKLMQYRQHERNVVGAERRPALSRLQRQIAKFGRLRHYYSEKLQETDEFLRQLDDLNARLSLQPRKFSRALAAIADRRRRLDRRRRRSARWNALLQWPI